MKRLGELISLGFYGGVGAAFALTAAILLVIGGGEVPGPLRALMALVLAGVLAWAGWNLRERWGGQVR